MEQRHLNLILNNRQHLLVKEIRITKIIENLQRFQPHSLLLRVLPTLWNFSILRLTRQAQSMRLHRTIREELQSWPMHLLNNQQMIHRQPFLSVEILLRSTTSMMRDHSEIRMLAIISTEVRTAVGKIKIKRSSIRVTGRNRRQTITIKMMGRVRGNTMRRTHMGMSRSSLRLPYNLRKLLKLILLLLLGDNKLIEIFTKD